MNSFVNSLDALVFLTEEVNEYVNLDHYADNLPENVFPSTINAALFAIRLAFAKAAAFDSIVEFEPDNLADIKQKAIHSVGEQYFNGYVKGMSVIHRALLEEEQKIVDECFEGNFYFTDNAEIEYVEEGF